MSERIKNKKVLSVLLAIVMLFGLMVPVTVLADAPVTIDTTIMAEGSNGVGYSGTADAAFEIVDGNTLKISFRALSMDMETMQMPNSVVSISTGYVNDTFTGWIARYSPTILFNDEELSSDTSADSYAAFSRNMVQDGQKYYDDVIIVVKPGVEITPDFFENNKITLAVYSQNIYVDVGTFDNGGAEPAIRSARTITPSKTEYTIGVTARDSGGSSETANNQPRWNCTFDNDKKWAYAITEITYSIDDSEPTSLTYYTGGWNNTASGSASNNKNIPVMITGNTIGIQTKLFKNMGIDAGTKKDVKFTIKATGYEDSTFTMSIKNPPVGALSVWNGNVATAFSLDDLTAMWEAEGSKEYTYSAEDTKPDGLEILTFYGPTLETVLSAAGIDVSTLADDDVLVFTASDGYVSKMTVKEFRETRYYFPNGESPADARFQGTTEAQLEGKVEVPYIISLNDGEKNLRNVFGQRDPQEEQKNDFAQKLTDISILKSAAVQYDGLTPTMDNGSTYKPGDKLNFDFSISDWQGSQTRYASIYYTVSTDGTEPEDPTLSSIFYNFHQYGSPNYNTQPNMFNSYEFTDADTTIIKVMAYIRAYAEPKVITLKYEAALDLTSSEGNELPERTHTTLTVKHGKDGYKYKFLVYNHSTEQWYVLQDFSDKNTCDWYTGPAGEKTLYADILDKDDDVVTRVSLSDVKVYPALKVNSLKSTAGTTLSAKSHTTLVAKASEGKAPYEYKFIVYNESTNQWYKIQDYSEKNTCDWYTGPNGKKKLYVDVRDSLGSVVRHELAVTVGEASSALQDAA